MKTLIHMRLEFDARPENESFARIAVSAFAVPFNPAMDVLSDIRTADDQYFIDDYSYFFNWDRDKAPAIEVGTESGQQATQETTQAESQPSAGQNDVPADDQADGEAYEEYYEEDYEGYDEYAEE